MWKREIKKRKIKEWMPEGPEVWLLVYALTWYDGPKRWVTVQANGKHMLVQVEPDVWYDWSFGLKGQVQLLSDGLLTKKSSGWMFGDIKPIAWQDTVSKVTDWWTMSSEKEQCSWWDDIANNRRRIADLITDQHSLQGVGVAWGSEWCYVAGVDPREKMTPDNMEKLRGCVDDIRAKIRKEYLDLFMRHREDVCGFINHWYEILYENRTMQVYRKGTSCMIAGRRWWIA